VSLDVEERKKKRTKKRKLVPPPLAEKKKREFFIMKELQNVFPLLWCYEFFDWMSCI
jgi:hypothetical protein